VAGGCGGTYREYGGNDRAAEQQHYKPEQHESFRSDVAAIMAEQQCLKKYNVERRNAGDY
jgi:hypothetical protein